MSERPDGTALKIGDRIRLTEGHPLAGKEGVIECAWYGGWWRVRLDDGDSTWVTHADERRKA